MPDHHDHLAAARIERGLNAEVHDRKAADTVHHLGGRSS